MQKKLTPAQQFLLSDLSLSCLLPSLEKSLYWLLLPLSQQNDIAEVSTFIIFWFTYNHKQITESQNSLSVDIKGQAKPNPALVGLQLLAEIICSFKWLSHSY